MAKDRPSLNARLETFHAGLMERLPDCDRMAKARDLAAPFDMAGRIIPQPGDIAPDFALPDQHGRMVGLAASLAIGPAVLLFIRGGWCPFCTLTLRAYQDCLPAIHDAGADLFAIAPQPVGSIYQAAERDLLAFSTLSDPGNAVARLYGVETEIPPELRAMYLRLGHDLPRLNATGTWRIPLPATFIVGIDGRVTLTSVEPQSHRRLEPSAVVAALRAMQSAALQPAT